MTGNMSTIYDGQNFSFPGSLANLLNGKNQCSGAGDLTYENYLSFIGNTFPEILCEFFMSGTGEGYFSLNKVSACSFSTRLPAFDQRPIFMIR